ncbi:hypothetical protein McanCB56680_008048, partial [Microsporum canis]
MKREELILETQGLGGEQRQGQAAIENTTLGKELLFFPTSPLQRIASTAYARTVITDASGTTNDTTTRGRFGHDHAGSHRDETVITRKLGDLPLAINNLRKNSKLGSTIARTQGFSDTRFRSHDEGQEELTEPSGKQRGARSLLIRKRRQRSRRFVKKGRDDITDHLRHNSGNHIHWTNTEQTGNLGRADHVIMRNPSCQGARESNDGFEVRIQRWIQESNPTMDLRFKTNDGFTRKQ